MPILLPAFIEAVKHYEPNERVKKILSTRSIVPIIGPTASGKSSLIEMVCSLDYNCSNVTSFTTRPHRRGEDAGNYRFLRHNQETINQITAAMLEKELVQIAVHPTTSYLYGSDPSDYSQEYNLVDMLASAMPTIRKLPFEKCIPIAVAIEPEDWQQWFVERVAVEPNLADSVKRLAEAHASLEWSLHDPDVKWVHNKKGKLKESAECIIDILCDDRPSDEHARNLGKAMLAQIPTIMAKLAASA